jgi:hypothetical protein
LAGNGGIVGLAEPAAYPAHFNGVMMRRAAYQDGACIVAKPEAVSSFAALLCGDPGPPPDDRVGVVVSEENTIAVDCGNDTQAADH